jgi:hypothetical protein
MAQYRKKPVVIEAVQWTGNIQEVSAFAGESLESLTGDTLWIKTLEGGLTARMNDWIIKGVCREFYPCKPDIFESTYEKV